MVVHAPFLFNAEWRIQELHHRFAGDVVAEGNAQEEARRGKGIFGLNYFPIRQCQIIALPHARA